VSLNNGAGSKETVMVWDADGPSPLGEWTPVLWRNAKDETLPKSVSIPSLIEADADSLKSRYLAWVYELGERRINGVRLVDYLEARPGFSFWWMTLIVEKCNFSKSPQITDAIRLMAFDDWATCRSIKCVVLFSASRPLSECMRLWCLGSGVSFEFRYLSDETETPVLARRLYQSMPYLLQALIWLARYLIDCWRMRGVGLSKWRETKADVTFVSYLFNLVPEALKAGEFESHYWSRLPKDLEREGYKTNWLHLYVRNELLPDPSAAVKAVVQFNSIAGSAQTHVTLDTFLNIGVVFRTLFDAGRLAWRCLGLRRMLFASSDSKLNLWPLFERDWRLSTYGLTAMSNALTLNLFESAMKSLPKQRLGVYLQENQGWEFALVNRWKALKHGRLVGVPHATVRYWDLRYFFDLRSYDGGLGCAFPMPDEVALNGVAELESYRVGGYPMGRVVEVEALRYLHLDDASAESKSPLSSTNDPLRILVLGDYLLSNTRKQLNLLEKAMSRLSKNTIVVVKPHPACPLRAEDYPRLPMTVSTRPIWELLYTCDVAYTSNATSAAADAYGAGLPVVSMLDLSALNQSPLRGRKGVLFVITAEDLALALISFIDSSTRLAGERNFFTIDPKLPRWRKLLLESVGRNAELAG
jgi:surface carbohydrate biosynthesis protein (TIGR04326 family)